MTVHAKRALPKIDLDMADAGARPVVEAAE